MTFATRGRGHDTRSRTQYMPDEARRDETWIAICVYLCRSPSVCICAGRLSAEGYMYA